MSKDAPSPSQAPHSDPERQALQALLPEFYAAVGAFEELNVAPGLGPEEIAALEKKLEFTFSQGLREFLGHCAAPFHGRPVREGRRVRPPLSCPAPKPWSSANFIFTTPATGCSCWPTDPAVYYLEQRNGAITKMADRHNQFF